MVFNEYALLGALLSNTKELVEIYKTIEPEAFSDIQCQIVYQAMREMFYTGKTIDIITVSDKLEDKSGIQKYFENIAILTFVSTLPDHCPVVSNSLSYMKAVENDYIKRKVVEVASQISEFAKNGSYESILDLKNDSIKLLSDIRVSDEKGIGTSFFDIVEICINNIINKRMKTKEEEEKLYTGFDSFDKITDGFHGQELTIIGARPAIGKTQFALALAKKLAERGNKIIFFSREMGDVSLGNRFLSNITGIEGHRIRRSKCLSEDEIDLLIETRDNIKRIRDLDVIFNTTASTVHEIRSVIREASLKKDVDVVIIDYLSLLQVTNFRGDRRAEIEYISRQLKLMTIEFNIPIICLSQLNRSSAKENREPELHDLRETGQIEADADNVVFLHVPSWTEDTDVPFMMKVIIAKQRNGPVADVWLWNDRNRMNMYNPSDEDVEAAKSMEGRGSSNNI